jgi:uncharacterized protein
MRHGLPVLLFCVFCVFCVFLETVVLAASFDCRKAASPVEKAICSDSQLSELDSFMGQTYKKALEDSSNPGALKAEQRSWLSNIRNRCQNAECLRRCYNDRLNEFYSAASSPRSGPSNSGGAEARGIRPVDSDMIDYGTLKLAGVGEEEPILEITFTKGHYRKGSPREDDFIDATVGKRAFGDLNGDNVDDAAIIITYNTGGSGSFISLCAVLGTSGKPFITDPILLGDRVGIKSVRIQSGKVVLDIVKHKPNDPSCCPTVPVTLSYSVENGKLVGPKFKDY